MHGKGELFYSDGTQYTGDFFNSKRQGYGTLIWPNMLQSYTGQFFNNKMHGKGKLKKGYKTCRGEWS